MSPSSDAVSGAHSGGLCTTVAPLASAGAIRHVASISGAFHGADDGRDPGRIPRHTLGVAVDLGIGRAVELQQLVGEGPEVACHTGHHRAHMRAQQRPVVASLDGSQLGNPGLDPVGDPMQHLGPLLRGRRAPTSERVARRLDRGIDRTCVAPGHHRDRLLVDRRDVDEPLGGCNPGAADQMVGRDLDAIDHRALVQRVPPSPRRSFVPER